MAYSRLFAFAALAATAPPLARAAPMPAGNHYRLNVTTSFEKPFTDCWSFATSGAFIHSQSLKNFPYQLDNLNTEAGAWQAIYVSKVSIAFAGTATAMSIAGNAIDRNGNTYSITGASVSGCGKVEARGWPK